jgi:hypothetical protein
MQRVLDYSRTMKSGPSVQYWDKSQHLARLQASGRFRYTKEIMIHHQDQGDGERFIERALSASFTCRLQHRSLFAYLRELLTVRPRGDPIPTLA